MDDDPATVPPTDAGSDVDAADAPPARTTTRRRALAAAGALSATALASPLLGTATAQDDEDDPETIRLRGEVSGWVGQEPARIEGEKNPTLYLDSGTEYRFVWENGDGVDHNLRLRNEAGDTIVTTETMGEEGATRSFTHTVTDDVVEYRCGIHGFSMQGEVSFEDPPTATPTATTRSEPEPTTEPTPTASPTPTATRTPTDVHTTTGTPTMGGDGGDGGDGSSDGGGLPGFGALAALAGLASAIGLARRRRD